MRVAPLWASPSNTTLEKTKWYQDLTQEEKTIVEKKKNALVLQEQLAGLQKDVVLHELKSEILPKSKEIQSNVNNKNWSYSNSIGNAKLKEWVEEWDYFDFNMDAYNVIHVPAIWNSAHCSEIARRNQHSILSEYAWKNRVVRGDAEMYVNFLQEQFKKQKKNPWESIRYTKKYEDGLWPINFTWLHDDHNIINPNTGLAIKELLMKSITQASTSSPHVREMFIDTEHKHRVTIVYGTGTQYQIESYIDKKWRTKKRKIPVEHTGLRCIDTLRGKWTGKTGDPLFYGKIPLEEYFSNQNFYINGDKKTYTDLYLRSQAPIWYEYNQNSIEKSILKSKKTDLYNV